MHGITGSVVSSLALAGLLLGCGDALVERGYRGEPLLQFTGQVTTEGGTVVFDAPLRASAFWSTETDEASLDDDLVEQAAVSVKVSFPGIFEINVFERPPDHAWADPDAGFRVGLVLVYEDLDRDGRYDAGELRGGARDQAMLFVERPLTARTSPTGVALLPGYHVVRLPMLCPRGEAAEGPDTPEGVPATCGVALGAACAGDADCAGGACLLRQGATPWTNGYCTTPVDDAQCGGVTMPTLGGRVLAPCHDDDDCRLSDGYRCATGDRGRFGCQPGRPAALVIAPDLVLAPICVEDDESD